MRVAGDGGAKMVGVALALAVLGIAAPVAAQAPVAPEVTASPQEPEAGGPIGSQPPLPAPPADQTNLPPAVIAQEPVPPPPARGPGEMAPSFVTLDRMDATSRVGVQVGFDKLDRVAVDDAFFMRFDLYGQYVIPEHNVGIFGQIPIARSFMSDALGGSQTAVGNLDVGAYLLPRGNNDLILRASLMFQTASDDQAALSAFVTAYERTTDLPLSVPNLTMLRLSLSTVQERDGLFFRGDLGFDVVLAQDGDSNHDLYGRLNFAAGVRAPTVDVALELVSYGVLDGPNPGGDITDRFIHTGALSVRSRGEHQFHGGFVVPLDDATRGELWILSLGYQHAI